jgi:hypothetical protein
MTALASPTDYQPYVGDGFLVRDGDTTATFTLNAVVPKIDDEVQRCFVLHFSSTVRWPQAIYRVTHPKLGEFDLFLVPVQTRKPGLDYEAVFNLLKEAGP